MSDPKDELLGVLYDPHPSHCCTEHGCKYGSPECSVVAGHAPQEFPCEYCGEVDEVERVREQAWNEGFEAASARLLDVRKRLSVLEVLCATTDDRSTDAKFRARWAWYKALPMAVDVPPEAEEIKKLKGLLRTARELVSEGASWVEWDPDGFGDRVKQWRADVKEATEGLNA